MDAAEIEALALRWRAAIGIIPYRIFVALTPVARHRLALLSQTRAQRELDALQAKPGTSCHPIDDAAVDALTNHKQRIR